jgi:hypothetical protein
MEAESKARLNAKGSVEETAGRVMAAVARELGLTVAELNKKLSNKRLHFAETPAYKEALAFAKDMLKRDRAADAGDLVDLRVGGTDGEEIDGQLPGLAALGVFMGRNVGGGKKGGNKGGGKTSNKGGGKKRQSTEPDDGYEQPSGDMAQEFADRHNGQYPRWDPEKRQPQYNG